MGSSKKKHRHLASAALGFVVDRQSPAKGCRHIVTKRDIHEFTSIIPDWSRICEGLEGVVLTRGCSRSRPAMGFRSGCVMGEVACVGLMAITSVA
jgi:hypothetical protein